MAVGISIRMTLFEEHLAQDSLCVKTILDKLIYVSAHPIFAYKLTDKISKVDVSKADFS